MSKATIFYRAATFIGRLKSENDILRMENEVLPAVIAHALFLLPKDSPYTVPHGFVLASTFVLWYPLPRSIASAFRCPGPCERLHFPSARSQSVSSPVCTTQVDGTQTHAR
jgi:hypothetical protein